MSLTTWAVVIFAAELLVFGFGIYAAFANRTTLAAACAVLGLAIATTLAWIVLLSEDARAADFPLVCVHDTTGGTA